MILGTIQYPSRYSGLGERVRRGLEYISQRGNELAELAPGKYIIDDDSIFFEISEQETTEPEKKYFEAHKKYYDIHVTLKGEEWFGHATVKQLTQAKPYDPESDTETYTGEGIYNQAPDGHFILFMPEDAHKCGIYFQKKGSVKSLVMKVKI